VEEGRRVRGIAGVKLDVLAVSNFDKGFGDLAVFAGQVKGLGEAEFLVKRAGGVEISDANGDVCDAGELGRKRGVAADDGGWRLRERRLLGVWG
jgi:hypothetical protein